jgi:hypothetical protein
MFELDVVPQTELNVVCPDGFEYHFVDEEFFVGREFELASE